MIGCRRKGKIKERLLEENGQITVLLTLLLTVLLSFFLVTLEIIRYEQAKGRVEQAAVGVVEQLMADFQIEMADWYHIYTLDENYLGRGKEVLNNRAWDYLEGNLSGTSDYRNRHSLYRFAVMDTEVEITEYITENGCHLLKQQIHNWNKNPMLLIEKRQKRQGKFSYRTEDKIKENRVESIMPEENTVWNHIEDSLNWLDPRNIINEIRHLGILTVVSNKQLPLSKIKYRLNELPSHSIQWKVDNNRFESIVRERAEVENYIFHHFHNALTTAKERQAVLENEMEYCITGKQSDYDCLEITTKKIVALRLPLNRAYLAKDIEKQEEAWSVAATIATITGQPEATKAIQRGILESWAYGESVMDVKCLLAGKKVPKVKNKRNWKLSFIQLFQLKNAVVTEEKNGFDYEDYLKILLDAVPEKKLYLRMLDLMQLTVSEKYPSFQISDCIGSYRVLGKIEMQIQFFPLPIKKRNHYEFVVDKSGSFYA